MQQNDPPLLVASNDQLGPKVPKRDVVGLLRNLERHGEDNIWRTAQEAREEIETLRTQLAHWKAFAVHGEGELTRMRIAVARAVPAMHSYASKNPKHEMNGVLQDPCGVHAWLVDFGA